jgi:glycerol-3-phosphate dehydrogenase
MEGINDKNGEVNLTKHYAIYDHKSENLDGLITVVGVKYTTARDVAEKTVNLAFKRLDKKDPGCSSHLVPLAGGDIGQFDHFLKNAIASSEHLSPAIIKHLVLNYGSRYSQVLKQMSELKNGLKPLNEKKSVTFGEIAYAVKEEMAEKLADVVFRRTDLGSAGHPGTEALKNAAETMGTLKGWSDGRKKEEIKAVESIYTWET